MRTVEQVQRDRGLDVRGVLEAGELKGCGYNPTKDGATHNDCGQIARWHAKVSSERIETGLTLISCDSHLGVIMTAYKDSLLGLHDFGEACGEVRSWWLEQANDCGSTCITEEDGIRMGYLVLAPIPDIGENQNHDQGNREG
jgi:hypothetical protein